MADWGINAMRVAEASCGFTRSRRIEILHLNLLIEINCLGCEVRHDCILLISATAKTLAFIWSIRQSAQTGCPGNNCDLVNLVVYHLLHLLVHRITHVQEKLLCSCDRPASCP